MSRFLLVPIDRLAPETCQSLLEEFASREGTEYGEREVSLNDKVSQLHRQLANATVKLVYDSESETWDLLDAEQADALACS